MFAFSKKCGVSGDGRATATRLQKPLNRFGGTEHCALGAVNKGVAVGPGFQEVSRPQTVFPIVGDNILEPQGELTARIVNM